MKNLVPVVVILLLLGVGGYYVMNSKSMNKPPASEQKVTTSPTQGSGLFGSIKDALSKSVSLKCEYPDPRTKATVTTYIKNGAVRVMGMSIQNNKSSNAIMKDNKMWIWTEGETQGMMLDLTIPATGKKVTGEPTREDQRERVLAEMEKYKNYCKTEVVADSLFTPPSDVKFTDLQNLMKDFKVPSGVMPSGYVIPTQPEE